MGDADLTRPEGLYRQVAHRLRQEIAGGVHQPGDALPSEAQLRERFKVSRQTIRQAIALLRNEGLVDVEHGRGTFVRQQPRMRRLARTRLSRSERQQGRGTFASDAAAGGWKPSVEVTIRREKADERAARKLGIEPGDPVLVRDRIMSADGVPAQLAVSRLPRAITEGTVIEKRDTGPGGIYARLEEAGYTLDGFVEEVGSRPATDGEAARLRIAPGSPVLTVTRTAYTTDGKPVETNDMVLPADRFELVYELPAD